MKLKRTIKNDILAALFAALTAVLAQIQLPIGPVPFNLALFGMFLAGMLLTPAWAAASAVLYMLLGLVGIPVFAGFQGGPAVLLGNTGGYLVGYLFVALATSVAQHRSGRLPVVAAGMALGIAICYAFGTAWYMALSGASLSVALSWCVLPFLLPDACKGALAYAVGQMLAVRLRAAGLAESPTARPCVGKFHAGPGLFLIPFCKHGKSILSAPGAAPVTLSGQLRFPLHRLRFPDPGSSALSAPDPAPAPVPAQARGRQYTASRSAFRSL